MSVLQLRVDSKVIVVTGGYGYLGKAIVESLSAHGATVIVAGRSEEKFNTAFGKRPAISFEQLDISDSASFVSGFKRIKDTHGRIDVLINNAFYLKGQSPVEMTDEEWNFGMDGVLGGVFKATREIIPHFKEQGHGKIINVSSMYGMVSPDFKIYEAEPDFLNPPHYGVAKAGILQLTRYYANYLGKENIQVNAVTPGPFPDESVQKNKAFITQLKDRTSLDKIGKPEDLGGVFTFLSSDAANFITGQNFIVDGGWTTK